MTSEPVWNEYLSEHDKAILAATGFGSRAGFGKRPAVVVIDVNYAFCGDKPEPILEAIKRWPNACGEDAWVSIGHIRELLGAARNKGVPVIYTTGFRREDSWDTGSWSWKMSRNRESFQTRGANRSGNDIVDEIAPAPQDIVVLKQKPSAFFGTNLMSYLVLLGCDSLIVAGTTTSGCIRATVLDAFSNNFRVAVVGECCFDRLRHSHAINLFDMNAKYADVVTNHEAIEFFDQLPDGLFDLPKGNPEGTKSPVVKPVAAKD